MNHDNYCINESVEYYDSSKGADHMWMATREQYEPLRILMVKDIKYKWQREYRFVINREIDTISPMVLDIGNIQDYVFYGTVMKCLPEKSDREEEKRLEDEEFELS